MTYLTGIDISYAQTTTPPLTGLAYVIVKASQANFVDPRWAQHSGNVRAAGLPLGAYCFGVSGSRTPVATQVQLFLATAKDADFLALDVEQDTKWPTSMTNAEASQFINAVHGAGRKIGLYHSLSGFPSLGQDFNWVAYWESVAPSIPWTFWQYSGTTVDHDKFAGDAAAFAAFLASQGADMPVLSSNPTPGYVDIPAGETLYDVDGVTVLGTTKQQLNTFSPGAPKGSTVLRLYWRSFQAGVWQLVSAAPNGAVRPLPTGFTQADLDAAYTSGYGAAKTKAASAVQAI